MCQILCFALKVQYKEMSLLRDLLSREGITPPAFTAHDPVPPPAVPSSLSLCCLRSSVLQSRVGMFPLSPPSPAALVWPCGPGRHAGGGERRPLRLRGGARLEAADGFRLKFLTVSLRCALTSFHLLSSFLEDFFFFFLRDCLLSHWDIIDNTALYFGVQDNDLIYVYIVKWSSQ